MFVQDFMTICPNVQIFQSGQEVAKAVVPVPTATLPASPHYNRMCTFVVLLRRRRRLMYGTLKGLKFNMETQRFLEKQTLCLHSRAEAAQTAT